MPIKPLEDTAVRAIGATQVLTDPAAVVKELLDNALDAKATSISIEISSNTVDTIQVRDNGHGIAPEDRALVARLNCTSKLQHFDELRLVGSTSLGFRGQALASAAEMSGNLTITTRVEGEAIATTLKVNCLGEVIGQERSSLPVGTTVKIIDFAKTNPVRRQHILKHTDKCLRAIKQCLQAYAFARPHVRLSLRVLKSKTEKFNWTYAPKPYGSVEDTALRIVGSACVQQCTYSVVEDSGFTLEAFLPRPDSEPSKTSNFGAFISVDGRPVSVSRGTFKQMQRLFRETLKAANPEFEGVKEPFLYLNIACPPDSYDPNIEPGKDDVLFEDAHKPPALLERLLQAVYPSDRVDASFLGPKEIDALLPSTSKPDAELDRLVTDSEPGKVLSSRDTWIVPEATNDLGAAATVSSNIHSDSDLDPGDSARHVLRRNMYGCDEDDLQSIDVGSSTVHTEVDVIEQQQPCGDPRLLNPWVMAKMNAPLRMPVCTPHIFMTDTHRGSPQPPSDSFALTGHGLSTPRPSSPLPRNHGFFRDHESHKNIHPNSVHLIGLESRDDPLQQGYPSVPFDLNSSETRHHSSSAQQPSSLHSHGLPTQSSGTPLDAIPIVRPVPRRQNAPGRLNRPFVSPVIDRPAREKVWFDHLEQVNRPFQRARRRYPAPALDELHLRDEVAGQMGEPRPLTPPSRNRDIREYIRATDNVAQGSVSALVERRNYAQAWPNFPNTEGSGELPSDCRNRPNHHINTNGFLPASKLKIREDMPVDLVETTPRPSKHRRTNEARVLRELNANTTYGRHVSDSDEEYEPSQAALLSSKRRRTTDGGSNKLQRAKSSQLPLERVPRGQGTQNLIFRYITSIPSIGQKIENISGAYSLLRFNQPALNAYDAFSTLSDPSEFDKLATRLEELLGVKISGTDLAERFGQTLGGVMVQHLAVSEF